jgi:3-deoxy-D-manno-octulosonate 8-phosphate phosphatase (KDO 8-P phosphatase)
METKKLEEIIEKVKKIKLLILDVDGVLTDGKLYVSESGTVMRSYDVKDGFGVYNLIKKGMNVAILSGKNEKSIIHRANTLGIKDLFLGKIAKLDSYHKLKDKYNLDDSEVAYIADDVFDIPVLEKVGLACCPNDASDEVRKMCDFISNKPGGNGAVREIADLIVKFQEL